MRVLLGVTGGIAAYKAAELTRELVRGGVEVQVLMTGGAQSFVTPLTFQALSGRAVRTTLLDPDAEMGMGHIELARWADLILIAPASANTLARIAAGLADDLLGTVLLASEAPLWLAPAMNQAMWRNPMTQNNVRAIQALRPDCLIIEPDSGEQACGDVGPGRMPEPEELARRVLTWQRDSGVGRPEKGPVSDLLGLRIVLTAGPTRERLDPVRYLSNDSSGKMGYALAAAAQQRGAQVTLISGPVSLAPPAGVELLPVESACDMLEAVRTVLQRADGTDWFVSAAAVADYRPQTSASQKQKKQGDAGLTLSLVQNPDILATVTSAKQARLTVGFAAETENLLEHARDKRQRKGVDLIVANNVSRPDIGFNSDENEVWIVSAADETLISRQSKTAVADKILDAALAADRLKRNIEETV